MSKCFIGLGKCSYFYFYILGAIILNFIKRSFFTSINCILFKHSLIQDVYKFFSFILFGIIFLFIQKSNLSKNKKKKIIKRNLIIFTKNDFYISIIVYFIYVIYLEIIKIISFFRLDVLIFWTAHLFFVLFFMNRYYPKNIYRHQIYPMILVIVSGTIVQIILTILPFEDGKNVYQVKGTGLCIFIILLYIFFVTLFSFSEMKIKNLTDFKYLSPYKIIAAIGLIGFTLTLITSLLFTFFGKDCNSQTKDINCYGAIPSYFSELKNKLNTDKTNFYLEIFIIQPFYLLIEFLSIIFIIFIYKYLNPYFLLLSDNIYYFLILLIDFIIKEKYNDS